MPESISHRPLPRRQAGFSLVEMMIATVIGLLVLLGATQLYLTISRSQDRSELLAERQQALTFGTENLMRDIRTATGALDADGSELILEGIRRSAYCPGNGAAMIDVVYYRDGDELMVDPDCADPMTMALVGGIANFEVELGAGVDEEAVDEGDAYSVHVTLTLAASGDAEEDAVRFTAVNRQLAMQNASAKDATE